MTNNFPHPIRSAFAHRIGQPIWNTDHTETGIIQNIKVFTSRKYGFGLHYVVQWPDGNIEPIHPVDVEASEGGTLTVKPYMGRGIEI